MRLQPGCRWLGFHCEHLLAWDNALCCIMQKSSITIEALSICVTTDELYSLSSLCPSWERRWLVSCPACLCVALWWICGLSRCTWRYGSQLTRPELSLFGDLITMVTTKTTNHKEAQVNKVWLQSVILPPEEPNSRQSTRRVDYCAAGSTALLEMLSGKQK